MKSTWTIPSNLDPNSSFIRLRSGSIWIFLQHAEVTTHVMLPARTRAGILAAVKQLEEYFGRLPFEHLGGSTAHKRTADRLSDAIKMAIVSSKTAILETEVQVSWCDFSPHMVPVVGTFWKTQCQCAQISFRWWFCASTRIQIRLVGLWGSNLATWAVVTLVRIGWRC